MIPYKNWRPATGDVRGLNADTMGFTDTGRGEWLVVACHNRDSDVLEESNFSVACARLAKVGAEADYEQHSFNHWACGWVEILIVRPGTECASEALAIQADLQSYPVLDEYDLGEREQEAADEVWKVCFTRSERLDYIRTYRSQFEFRTFADMLGCVRGKYFAGDASELAYGH